MMVKGFYLIKVASDRYQKEMISTAADLYLTVNRIFSMAALTYCYLVYYRYRWKRPPFD